MSFCYDHGGASNWPCPPLGYTSNASDTYASAMAPFCSPGRMREMQKMRNAECNYWQKIKPQCQLTCCGSEAPTGPKRLRNSVPYKDCEDNKSVCNSVFPSPTNSYENRNVKRTGGSKSFGSGCSSPRRVQPPPPVNRRPLRNLYKDSYSAWNYDSDCNDINGYDVRPTTLSDLYGDEMPLTNGELYDLGSSLEAVRHKGNDMLPFGGGEKGNRNPPNQQKPSNAGEPLENSVDKGKGKESQKKRGSGSSSGNYILVKTTKTVTKKKKSTV